MGKTTMTVSEKLKEAITKLKENNLTLSIIHGENVHTSTDRGVKPLLSLIDVCGTLCGAVAADKVVGKAAAFLYIKLGVFEIYADVISTHALELLQKNGIKVAFGEESAAIRNRRGDGFCPMESAVMDISDADEALSAIRSTLARLSSSDWNKA